MTGCADRLNAVLKSKCASAKNFCFSKIKHNLYGLLIFFFFSVYCMKGTVFVWKIHYIPLSITLVCFFPVLVESMLLSTNVCVL